MVATAYCSRTCTLAGGSGCTTHRLGPTSLRALWFKVYRSHPVDSRSIPTTLSALGHSQITCAPIEYVIVKPPRGQTCQQYLSKFISTAGGYVTNPSAKDDCQFCSYRTTDEFLQSNSNFFWSHRWRNIGFLWIYIVFNVRPHRIITCR
jgi:ATP-binding cassette subfamily G (WHITE) protein 2 (SNQ2)